MLETKGDVYYSELGTYGEVKTLLRENKINVIVCNPNKQHYVIDREMLEGTEVKVINSCSTGLNHIDIKACEDMNIEIQCHKNDIKLIKELPSTAELAFTLMMNLMRNVDTANRHVLAYGWDYTQFMGHQLKDSNVGILGYGRLGKMMFKYCEAFGANVKIYDPYIKNELSDAFLLNNWSSSLEELFEWAKVVSIHVHVTDETKQMINKDILKHASDLYLVNTSRGDIVDEQHVVDGLLDGSLAGYGTDVLVDEFSEGPVTNTWGSPIIGAMHTPLNILTTPHIGGMTWEGQLKAYLWSVNKIKDII